MGTKIAGTAPSSAPAGEYGVAAATAREQAILAAMRAPVITTSPDGRITSCNAAAAALRGDGIPLLGRPIEAILPFVVAEGPPGEYPRAWTGRLEDADSHPFDVEVTETRLSDGPEPADRLYVAHNISQHAELNRLREQLLYSVAHELRAPMALLENTLDIAATEYGSLSVREFDQLMRSARNTSLRLRTLMEDLLSAGNIQSGHFMVNLHPNDVGVMLDGAIESVEILLKQRGQWVERRIPDRDADVMADPRYVRQILSNLLANASKYGPRDRPISVTAERHGRQVRIAVADRGPGIPEEHQAGLFDRFYRVRPGNEEPGIGLGLAIVKGIAVAHGGTVGIESEAGEGTRVWFTLPRPAGAARRPPPKTR